MDEFIELKNKTQEQIQSLIDELKEKACEKGLYITVDVTSSESKTIDNNVKFVFNTITINAIG